MIAVQVTYYGRWHLTSLNGRVTRCGQRQVNHAWDETKPPEFVRAEDRCTAPGCALDWADVEARVQ